MVRYDYVCSVENTAYMEWQAMVFHHSVLMATGRPPIIAVMIGRGEPLLPGFRLIARTGGNLQRCLNYRNSGHSDFSIRNTPGCLLEVETDADYVVLCDADMILTRETYIPPLRDNEVSMDNWAAYSMDPVRWRMGARVKMALPRVRLTLNDLSRWPTWGGVPHVIPRTLMRSLGREWLACCEMMLPQCDNDMQPRIWEAAMWGLVFAIVRLGLEPTRTYWVDHNDDATRRWDPWWSMIHYPFNGGEFDKKGRMAFPDGEIATTSGSVNRKIVNSLRDAKAWYVEQANNAGFEWPPATERTTG